MILFALLSMSLFIYEFTARSKDSINVDKEV